MDRLSSISAFVASSYQNVALKDNDGNLLVHPDVKKVWDAALETIPTLLDELEMNSGLHLEQTNEVQQGKFSRLPSSPTDLRCYACKLIKTIVGKRR